MGGGFLFVFFINPMILYYEILCSIPGFHVSVQIKTAASVFVTTSMLGMGIVMLTGLCIFGYSLVSSLQDKSTF